MSISIGGFTLDDSFVPNVSISYEYYKSQSGEIIGGHQLATIKGIVAVDGDENTGAVVMSRLAAIRDLGKQTKCLSISIPGIQSSEGKVTAVNIEQGPDPAWINQGAYTIEVKAPLQSIPANSYGITAQDGVTDISRTESLEVGEESHGFVYTGGGFSKAYAKFSNNLTFTCQPLCNNASGGSSYRLLSRLLKVGMTNPVFDDYKGWSQFMNGRTLDLKSDGITFTAEMILMPPGQSAGALVDINFGFSRDYNTKTTTKTISGTINGLAPVSWSNPATLTDTFSASKLSNALAVLGIIKGRYSSLSSWQGSPLELNKRPNCPPEDGDGEPNTCDLGIPDEPESGEGCIEPSSSTVTISRTEGNITFDFQWSNLTEDGECKKNGVKKEITIEIIDPQPQFVEHVLPGQGTLIQNLKCDNAKRVNATVSISVPQDECNKYLDCPIDDDVQDEIDSYLKDGTYLLIESTKTISTGGVSIRQNYIKCEAAS